MKGRILTVLAGMVLMMSVSMPVFAGSINSAEQRIINSISATYEYGDGYYKVTDDYVAKVTEYLGQDGIDLTDDEVTAYLNQFYANFSAGIEAGYIVCVGKLASEESNEEQTNEEENTQSNASEEHSEDEHREEYENEKNTVGATESVESEETESVISDAIKLQDFTKGAQNVDNTLGSTVSGVQEYTVAEVDRQDMYVWDTEVLDVHEEAYKDSKLIGTLQKGDKVVVIGAATTGWAQIEFYDSVGYVSAFYLRTPGYMQQLGFVTEEESSQEGKDEAETDKEKNYYDAEPFQREIRLEVVAVAVVLIVIVGMVCILVWNRKGYDRK